MSYSRYGQGVLEYNTANTYYPCGSYLKQTDPNVVDYTTIARNYNNTISFVNARGKLVYFNEDKSYFAPGSFFSIFNFPVILGTRSALDAPNKVVITERIAKKYFNGQSAIGRVIKVNGTTSYEVAGVLKDLPVNTHLKFDFLFSIPTHLKELGPGISNNWGYDLFYTYLKLRPGASVAAVEKKFPQMIANNYGKQLAGGNEADFFKIQRVTDIHLHSNLEWETEKPGNGDAVTILMYFSLFVLLITWVNQVNLLSAGAHERAKEVGIRKTLGSSRWSVLWRFSAETAIVNVFSILLAALILLIAFFVFNKTTSVFPIEVYRSLGFWLIIFTVIIVGVLLTSIIPSLIISRFQPVHVLKGKLVYSFKSLFLRKALIGFQFVISFILITGAIIIYNQGSYLMKKDRGLDNKSVIAINFPKIAMPDEVAKEKSEVFKDEVKSLPWITDYTMATDMPEKEIETFGGMYRPERGGKDLKYYFRVGADENYFKFFKVKLVAGRFFSKYMATDKSALILNQSAVKKLGFDNPNQAIGQIIKDDGRKDKIIVGVVADFHYRSIKVKPVATMFNLQANGLSYFGIKLKTGDINSSEHIAAIEKIYSDLFPGNPFDYFFLEDAMKQDLQPDLDFAKVFALFSGMSVIISLIGLLGLVMLNLRQRVKELGIRKAIGANFSNIFLLVFKALTIPIGVALCIGIPLSVWGFSEWIAKYYLYHIAISWYYLAVPAILLTLLAALVIVFQVVRAYNQKIINSLKYE